MLSAAACSVARVLMMPDRGRIRALLERGLKLEPYAAHGHCFAKGVSVVEMMKEFCGKKGGSMHIADLSKGMMGANGILGARFRKKGGVAVSLVGDRASNQGTFL
jgi:TPP-dependent pyruvate/acetoin dehydrogenase alpha subunit